MDIMLRKRRHMHGVALTCIQRDFRTYLTEVLEKGVANLSLDSSHPRASTTGLAVESILACRRPEAVSCLVHRLVFPKLQPEQRLLLQWADRMEYSEWLDIVRNIVAASLQPQPSSSSSLTSSSSSSSSSSSASRSTGPAIGVCGCGGSDGGAKTSGLKRRRGAHDPVQPKHQQQQQQQQQQQRGSSGPSRISDRGSDGGCDGGGDGGGGGGGQDDGVAAVLDKIMDAYVKSVSRRADEGTRAGRLPRFQGPRTSSLPSTHPSSCRSSSSAPPPSTTTTATTIDEEQTQDDGDAMAEAHQAPILSLLGPDELRLVLGYLVMKDRCSVTEVCTSWLWRVRSDPWLWTGLVVGHCSLTRLSALLQYTGSQLRRLKLSDAVGQGCDDPHVDMYRPTRNDSAPASESPPPTPPPSSGTRRLPLKRRPWQRDQSTQTDGDMYGNGNGCTALVDVDAHTRLEDRFRAAFKLLCNEGRFAHLTCLLMAGPYTWMTPDMIVTLLGNTPSLCVLSMCLPHSMPRALLRGLLRPLKHLRQCDLRWPYWKATANALTLGDEPSPTTTDPQSSFRRSTVAPDLASLPRITHVVIRRAPSAALAVKSATLQTMELCGMSYWDGSVTGDFPVLQNLRLSVSKAFMMVANPCVWNAPRLRILDLAHWAYNENGQHMIDALAASCPNVEYFRQSGGFPCAQMPNLQPMFDNLQKLWYVQVETVICEPPLEWRVYPNDRSKVIEPPGFRRQAPIEYSTFRSFMVAINPDLRPAVFT